VGIVTFEDTALFTGTGLPGSQVKARLVSGDLHLNSTTVKDDGTWKMEISTSQLGDDGSYGIYFDQNDQTIGKNDGTSIMLTSGEPETAGMPTWLWVVIAIVSLAVLLGVGTFFFLEFEEFDDAAEMTQEQQKEEDPYAWAKARAAEQAVAGTMVQNVTVNLHDSVISGDLVPAAAPMPAAQPQHPGWIWDAQTNQWVADPNYTPPQE
jgi:hypothetical protein